MEFRAITLPRIDLGIRMPKIRIPRRDKTKWHRKFAFKPILIGNTFYWLCNVYRRREDYASPYSFKEYWNYIPYNDLALIHQVSLETSGAYMSRTYDPDLKRFPWGGVTFFSGMAVLLAVFIAVGVVGFQEQQKFKEDLFKQIDNAQTLDELKPTLKRMLQSAK